MARLGLIVVIGTTLSLCGCKVSRPSAGERTLLIFIKHHVTIGNKQAKNPLTPITEHIAAGRVAFSHYCIACHGLDGQNTGVPFADSMSPPPPLLTSPDVQQYTDGQLKWVIDNGISPSGMPASKGMLSDEEIWSIVLYLRHLPPAGSAGEPEMYSH